MLRKEIAEQYFGVKLSFDRAPVQGYPLGSFYYTSSELLSLLSIFFQQYELLMPEMEYKAENAVPVKLSTPHHWQDLAPIT